MLSGWKLGNFALVILICAVCGYVIGGDGGGGSTVCCKYVLGSYGPMGQCSHPGSVRYQPVGPGGYCEDPRYYYYGGGACVAIYYIDQEEMSVPCPPGGPFF